MLSAMWNRHSVGVMDRMSMALSAQNERAPIPFAACEVGGFVVCCGMNVRLVWILSLLMIGLGCAAEIVAWKVPLNRFAWGGLETEGVARLKSAPEESPFFTDGDELWDLKGIAIENSEGVKVAPEWVVWNAGTGRLVAKGDWAKITAIHEMLRIDQLASHCRLKLSLVPVTDEALVPSRDSKPVAEISGRR